MKWYYVCVEKWSDLFVLPIIYLREIDLKPVTGHFVVSTSYIIKLLGCAIICGMTN